MQEHDSRETANAIVASLILMSLLGFVSLAKTVSDVKVLFTESYWQQLGLVLQAVLKANMSLIGCTVFASLLNLFVTKKVLKRKFGLGKQGSRLDTLLKETTLTQKLWNISSFFFLISSIAGVIYYAFFKEVLLLKGFALPKDANLYLVGTLSLNFSLALYGIAHVLKLIKDSLRLFELKTNSIPKMPRLKNTIVLGTIGEQENE